MCYQINESFQKWQYKWMRCLHMYWWKVAFCTPKFNIFIGMLQKAHFLFIDASLLSYDAMFTYWIKCQRQQKICWSLWNHIVDMLDKLWPQKSYLVIFWHYMLQRELKLSSCNNINYMISFRNKKLEKAKKCLKLLVGNCFALHKIISISGQL